MTDPISSSSGRPPPTIDPSDRKFYARSPDPGALARFDNAYNSQLKKQSTQSKISDLATDINALGTSGGYVTDVLYKEFKALVTDYTGVSPALSSEVAHAVLNHESPQDAVIIAQGERVHAQVWTQGELQQASLPALQARFDDNERLLETLSQTSPFRIDLQDEQERIEQQQRILESVATNVAEESAFANVGNLSIIKLAENLSIPFSEAETIFFTEIQMPLLHENAPDVFGASIEQMLAANGTDSTGNGIDAADIIRAVRNGDVTVPTQVAMSANVVHIDPSQLSDAALAEYLGLTVWQQHLQRVAFGIEGNYTHEQRFEAQGKLDFFAIPERMAFESQHFGIDHSGGGGPSLHTILDVAGMVPLIGEFADALNAGIYVVEGDWVNAGISAAALIPVGGQAVTGGRLASKVVRAAEKIDGAVEATYKYADGKTVHVIRHADGGTSNVIELADGSVVYGVKGADEAASLATRASSDAVTFIDGRIPRNGDRVVLNQGAAPTCGPVSCGMVLETAGKRFDVQDLIFEANVGPNGVYLDQLVPLLKTRGVDASVVSNLSIDDIAKMTAQGDAMIVAVMQGGAGHALVVDGITTRLGKEVVAIRDPWGQQYFETVEVFEERLLHAGIATGGS